MRLLCNRNKFTIDSLGLCYSSISFFCRDVKEIRKLRNAIGAQKMKQEKFSDQMRNRGAVVSLLR